MPSSPISAAAAAPAVNTKPLRRSERLSGAAPALEVPARESLLRLFSKYDVQAPRYTSYPPATMFAEGYDGSSHLNHIARTETSTGRSEVSLYVHLPFCDTLCYFCGCTMLISNNRGKISEYLAYLKREMALVAQSFDAPPTVVQMHWGGGSPTHLLPEEIEDLGVYIRGLFPFAPDAEVSIEIDPRGVTYEHVLAMQLAGFNRASVGVQDLHPQVQIAINRVQSRDITEHVIRWCRECGITSINIDLIYGLPYQSLDSFRATLDAVKEIDPDRIAVYNFAYVPWVKPHQKLIEIETLPSASNKLALLELAISELTAAGYEYLGMDHFAKPSDALVHAQHDGSLQRNFQGYSTHAGKDLLAFGISAIGRIENAFGQNVKELDAYYQLIEAGQLPIQKGYVLSTEDQIREYTIMQLMCNSRVEKREVTRLFGIDFDEYFAPALQQLETLAADELCELDPHAVRITETGRYFLRNIATVFDQYYGRNATQFSRTI